MSDVKVQEGDYVRVVLEGEVTSTGSAGFVLTSGPGVGNRFYVHPDSLPTLSVEKVARPLPTTPGSVIRRTNRNGLVYRVLNNDGAWAGRVGVRMVPFSDADEWEIVYDAGAAK